MSDRQVKKGLVSKLRRVSKLQEVLKYFWKCFRAEKVVFTRSYVNEHFMWLGEILL